ncbi:TonB-dependent receptor [Pedobacter sp. UYP1]|uniref:SusC/RagA family TonB-linked outer membrane protein n=1 Tax=Pedobacter sp. UYP1 TaxID=1756396 RepID=UPI0033981274
MQNLAKAGESYVPALIYTAINNIAGFILKKRVQTYQFILFILFLQLITPLITLAQDNQPLINSTLVGRVLDDKTKEALPGVLVQIKGTTHKVATDDKGRFNFKTGQKFPYTLIISFIGYEKLELNVDGSPVEILLKEATNNLNDVVVVGYGTQRRKDITGSVASIKLEEVKGQPVSSPERLLQGSIPGVQVTQSTGQPGGGVSVQVRGTASLTAGSQPLYVIDGFPFYNDEKLADAGVTSGPKINLLSSINPGDIESIDVLKDASSTAIYGSRGANGVIIINTKKGTAGKSSINFDSYYGTQEVVKTIPLLNASEWGQLRNDALVNAGKAPFYTQAQIDALGVGTDWQAAAFRKAAIQSHNLSILTGTEKTKFAISGNYFKQDGVLQNTGFTRYSGRLNVEHQYNERLKIVSYIAGSSSKAQVAPQSVVPNLLLMTPAVPVYNPDGSFYLKSPFEGTYGNPINTLYNQLNETRTNLVLGNASADYRIIDGLQAKVAAGVLIVDNKQNRYLPSTVYEGSGTSGLAQIGTLFTTRWLNENTLNYTKQFNNDHNINVLVGYTQESAVTKGSIAGAAGFATDETSYNDLSSGIISQTPFSSSYATALRSFLARANYGYRNKYLLTLTLRADGSSRFADGHQWGTFPSAALAWNATEEDFLKGNRVITNLKVRFSAGVTGNQEIPPYQSYSRETFYRYNFNGSNASGYAPGTNANPNLTWEKTAQYNLGIDLALFNSRINVVADVYYKKTTDLLYNITVPATSGLLDFTTLQSQIYQNIGAVQNKGFELGINTKNLVGDFKWSTNLIFAINRNKVLSLDNVNQLIPDSALPSVAAVGYPIGSFIVYKTDGLIPAGTPPAQALTPSGNKTAGGQQYVDKNGDGKITQAGDRYIIANQPLFTGGITNNVSYKGFDLSVFFQTSYGNKLYNQNNGTLELGTGYTNAPRTLLNRYTATNTNTDVHNAYTDPAVTISDRFIEDASYLRLKNVTFGYTIPHKILNKAGIKSVRFYVSAQNLWTWTKYTGYDPEANYNGQSAINSGVDNGVYPNSKTIMGGATLSF